MLSLATFCGVGSYLLNSRDMMEAAMDPQGIASREATQIMRWLEK